MKETKQMMEILHQNKLKAQKRELVERRKQVKDHNKKELLKIVALVIIAFTLTALLIIAVNKQLTDDYNNCLSEHSASYCETVGSI